MNEANGQIFDALVHGFYLAAGIGAVVGVASWSLATALITCAASFVLTGVAPAIYHLGRRDQGRERNPDR